MVQSLSRHHGQQEELASELARRRSPGMPQRLVHPSALTLHLVP
jgi:hypothetical protein